VASTLTDASLEAAPVAVVTRRPSVGTRIAALPIAVSLGGLVLLSILVRFLFALLVPAPWIFADELTYSELAKSFAATGHFAIRDVPSLGVGPLYPIVISPAWAAFSDVPHAYVLAKGINSVLMSLTAVPTYLLARRLLTRSWSLVAAGLVLLVPSTIYAGTIMTENLFYPLFVASSLGIVLTLERPTARRQLGTLILIGLAVLTRSQAIALLAAFVTAIVATSATDAALKRLSPRFVVEELRRYVITWLTLLGGFVALLGWQSLSGRPTLAILGDNRGLLNQAYSLADVAKWFVYHVAELDLYVGLLPFAALIVLAFNVTSRTDRQLRVFAIAALSISFWLVLVVAFFTSGLSRYDVHSYSHVEDRYTFYVVPLLVIALLAWITRRTPGSPRLAAAAAIAAGGLILVLPLRDLIHNNAVPDALAFLPWVVTDAEGMVIARPYVELFAAVVTIALAILFYRLYPPRLQHLSPLLLVLYFGTLLIVAERWYVSEGAVAVAAGQDKAWVDHAIPPGREAVAVYSGTGGAHLILESEFFNRRVSAIYFLRKPTWVGLPETKLVVRQRSGLLVDGSGAPLRARYILVDPWVVLQAPVAAQDRKTGMRLYRLDGRPARIGAL
jgi:hypothetical protein